MSALGHYLEEEGIATVAISLIRPQTEKTKPPRALWVPFELGRPFGPPSDRVFQKRVILSALRLLERADGPMIIADFPDDDPRAAVDPGWEPPMLSPLAGSDAAAALAAGLLDEIVQLGDAHARWVAERGRTTIGLAGLPIGESAGYVAEWLRGAAPASPRDGFSAPLMLRFAVDDLKAYCLEAATGVARPSSRQLGDWFWNKTTTGAALQALRLACLANDDERLKLIGSNFIVPAARVRSPA